MPPSPTDSNPLGGRVGIPHSSFLIPNSSFVYGIEDCLVIAGLYTESFVIWSMTVA